VDSLNRTQQSQAPFLFAFYPQPAPTVPSISSLPPVSGAALSPASSPPARAPALPLPPSLQKVPTPCPLLQGALLPPYLHAASLKTAHSPASPPPAVHLWSLLGPSRRIRSPNISRMHILWRSGSAQADGGWGMGVVSTGSTAAAKYKVILVLANHSFLYGIVVFHCFSRNQISVSIKVLCSVVTDT
jgi:hypothetical protein